MRLTEAEIRALAPFLSQIAINYLRTGEYETVTTLGGETLTPANRRMLDNLRNNPMSVSANQLMKVARREIAPQSLQQVVKGIGQGREQRAAEQVERTAAAAVPSPQRPPTGPLPQGQAYQYDYRRKVWMVIENGNRYISDVNQSGQRVEQTGGAPTVDAQTRASEVRPDTYSATGQDEQRFLQAGGATEVARAADQDALELLGTPARSTPLQPTVAAPAGGRTTDVGGETPSGVVPGPAAEPAAEMAADTGVPTDWEAAAAEMYPEYYAVVKNIPEIADLLRRSLGPPAWSDAKFQAELRATNWYKTTSASAREWDLKSAADPATYQAMVDEQATNISTQALNFGIRLSAETAQKLALDSLRGKFGEQTIINSIGMAATAAGSPGATQLREGYYGQSVRQIAKRYGVTLAEETFNSFVNRIAVGDETMDSFQDYALNIAKALYPSVAAQFDAGRTFDDITSPFRQIAASTLEISPESIDFSDPKWVTPIVYQPDPKTGEQRLMNLSEWGRELRTNKAYGYEFTNQAKQQAYSVVETLGNLFGRI